MRDSQRAAVKRAEDALWEHPRNRQMRPARAEALLKMICVTHGARAPEVHSGDEVELSGSELVLPEWAMKPVVIAHMAAHAMTPRIFPAHGVEFAASWLSLMREQDRALGGALRTALDAAGVRHDPELQIRDVRRRLVDAVNNNRGAPVLLTLADPPQEVYGPISGARGLSDGVVYVGGDPIPLSRVRYASQPRRWG